MQVEPRKTDSLERIERLLDILVRLKLRELKADRNQTETILLLGEVGMTGGEIASLVGISRKTVDPTLSKARRKSRTKQKTPRALSKKAK